MKVLRLVVISAFSIVMAQACSGRSHKSKKPIANAANAEAATSESKGSEAGPVAGSTGDSVASTKGGADQGKGASTDTVISTDPITSTDTVASTDTGTGTGTGTDTATGTDTSTSTDAPVATLAFSYDKTIQLGKSGAIAGCADVVDPSITGTQLNLKFEVLEDDTTISLAVGRLCGIKDEYNYVSLSNESQEFNYAYLAKADVSASQAIGDWKVDGTEPVGTPNPAKLKKGTYSIYFISDTAESFLIGNLKLSADKGIKIVGVTASSDAGANTDTSTDTSTNNGTGTSTNNGTDTSTNNGTDTSTNNGTDTSTNNGTNGGNG